MNRCLVSLGALITPRDQLYKGNLGVFYGRVITNITILDDDDDDDDDLSVSMGMLDSELDNKSLPPPLDILGKP
jgi:hypothetical protein